MGISGLSYGVHRNYAPPRLHAPAVRFGAGRTFTPYPLTSAFGQQIAAKSELLPKIMAPDIAKGTHLPAYPQFEVKHDLKHAISTHGLFQCAGLIMIDKAKNKHYLGHISHFTGKDDIQTHLSQLDMDPTQSEIFILPGCDKLTGHTVGQILEGLDAMSPGLADKVQFVHMPPEGFNVVSYDGKVWYMEGNRRHFDESNQFIRLSGKYKPGWCKPG
jgi:hypothetical protein